MIIAYCIKLIHGEDCRCIRPGGHSGDHICKHGYAVRR